MGNSSNCPTTLVGSYPTLVFRLKSDDFSGSCPIFLGVRIPPHNFSLSKIRPLAKVFFATEITEKMSFKSFFSKVSPEKTSGQCVRSVAKKELRNSLLRSSSLTVESQARFVSRPWTADSCIGVAVSRPRSNRRSKTITRKVS